MFWHYTASDKLMKLNQTSKLPSKVDESWGGLIDLICLDLVYNQKRYVNFYNMGPFTFIAYDYGTLFAMCYYYV